MDLKCYFHYQFPVTLDMSLLPDRPYQLPCYHWHFLGTFQNLYQVSTSPGSAVVIDGSFSALRYHAKTQNPKQVSLNPRHNYPKSLLQQTFCSTHEHEPTKKDGSLSVFKYMLLLALLSVVLSSCDTSEPSYTKQSFMNAKEHSNTETLFQRNAEAFSKRKLHSQTNS